MLTDGKKKKRTEKSKTKAFVWSLRIAIQGAQIQVATTLCPISRKI